MATKSNPAGKSANKGRGTKHKGNMIPMGLAHKKGTSAPEGKGKSPDTVAGLVGADPAYLQLIARLPLRPIRTEADLDAAAGVIDELIDRDDLSAAESDYLDVLGDLVEKYEDEHVEMPYVSDGAMLRTLVEEKGVRQADVVRGTGISKTVLSLVLSGKRDLTREHIAALSRYFDVDPAVFLGPA
jgi:HTH-type transcriptional regulator/antitoxin HigA